MSSLGYQLQRGNLCPVGNLCHEELTCVRLAFTEIEQNIRDPVQKTRATSVPDCKGLHGSLARNVSARFGAGTRRSAVKALSQKQSVLESDTDIRFYQTA